MRSVLGAVKAKTIVTFVAASMAGAGPGAHRPAGRYVHAGAVLPGHVHTSAALPVTRQAAPHPVRNTGCINRPAGLMDLRIRGDQAFVSLSVDHAAVNMLLDTGDFVTSLTPEVVRRLHLAASSIPYLQMTGLNGPYEAPIVNAAYVQYLAHVLKTVAFAVLPEGEFAPNEDTGGLFGANFLSAYDVEMDFAGKQLRFYDAPGACGWSGPRWTLDAAKYYATDIGNALLLIPIRVNGVELNALIDTGSEDTSITADAAAALGVTKASTRQDAVITESGLGVTTSRLHNFASITIGSTTFKRPLLAIDDGPSIQQEQNISAASPRQPGAKHIMAAILGPDVQSKRSNVPVSRRHVIFSAHSQLDVILGADFLFRKKVYLAYHQNAVFIN